MNEAERRWRLVLGKNANQSLSSGSLNRMDSKMQRSLDFLYSRNYDKRGFERDYSGKKAGSQSAEPTVLDWLKELPKLFPEEVCETIRYDAIDKFELHELLNDPETLKNIEPNQQVLESLMLMKGKMNSEVLAQLRIIIRKVVEELTERLRQEIQSQFQGRKNPNRRSFIKSTKNFDWHKTIKANLKHYDKENDRLVLDQLYFNSRVKKRVPWDIVLCVDQSGSMASSVIYAAVLAGILSGLPSVSAKIVVFDTRVVDLTHHINDPVEMLMTVQLGGGTNIGMATQYCEALINNPHRTIFALISDFYEGADPRPLLSSIKRMVDSQVTTLGLAALDDVGGADFDRGLAERLGKIGMNVGAMTPNSFAQWVAEVIDS